MLVEVWMPQSSSSRRPLAAYLLERSLAFGPLVLDSNTWSAPDIMKSFAFSVLVPCSL